MNLSPAEILSHLGFDIPNEGIEINPHDAYLFTSALRLAGESISADRIPDTKLAELHLGMAGIVSGWTENGRVKPMEISEVPSEDSLLRLRLTVKTLLQTTFKQRFEAVAEPDNSISHRESNS